jgi:succinyl-CoA:acetate CoA-transferase
VRDRIGTPYTYVDPNKIVAIVPTDQPDNFVDFAPGDAETDRIAEFLLDFFEQEIELGRMTYTLRPLQSGVGSVSNAVLAGLSRSRFHDLLMYSEVLQDGVFDLLDSGKLNFASATAISLSPRRGIEVMKKLDEYRDRLILRPQEISNHPQLIRQLGIIAMNTALEADIYGNVNSTHVMGTHIMNGIGGSGDFARNAYLSIFVTKSTAKGGKISSIVPMASHVDHTEHDVEILVTEQGLADLRGLAPRERAEIIIEKCAHPSFQPALRDYYEAALKGGGQTPHVLEKALSWHARYKETGSML